MDPDIAPMVISLTFILTTGGVILLYPVTKRLAELLQAMTQERLTSPKPAEPTAELRELLERMDSRLALLEERQGFTESLLEGGKSVPAVPLARGSGRAEA